MIVDDPGTYTQERAHTQKRGQGAPTLEHMPRAHTYDGNAGPRLGICVANVVYVQAAAGVRLPVGAEGPVRKASPAAEKTSTCRQSQHG